MQETHLNIAKMVFSCIALLRRCVGTILNRFGEGVTKCRKETEYVRQRVAIQSRGRLKSILITVHMVLYGRTVRLSPPLLSCSAARVGVKSEFRAILCTKKVLHFKLVGTRVFTIFFFMFLYSQTHQVTLKI